MKDYTDERCPAEELQQPTRVNELVSRNDGPSVLNYIRVCMWRRHLGEQVWRNDKALDISPHLPIGHSCEHLVVVRQAANDLAQHTHEAWVVSGVHFVSLAPIHLNGHESMSDIATSPKAVHLLEATPRLSVPEFIHDRGGFTGDQEDGTEVRLVIHPAAIAGLTSRRNDPLDL